MAKFLLTNRAVADLSDIADFTIQTFSIEQARFYRDGLNHCFEILTENSHFTGTGRFSDHSIHQKPTFQQKGNARKTRSLLNFTCKRKSFK